MCVCVCVCVSMHQCVSIVGIHQCVSNRGTPIRYNYLIIKCMHKVHNEGLFKTQIIPSSGPCSHRIYCKCFIIKVIPVVLAGGVHVGQTNLATGSYNSTMATIWGSVPHYSHMLVTC